MSLRRPSGEADAGTETAGNDPAASAKPPANPADPSAPHALNAATDTPDWSAEEVAWFRRGFYRRWQGPRAVVALAGLFVTAIGYWGTVAYLVGARFVEPATSDCFGSSAAYDDFENYELRPVPGTIPWQWQNGAGGISGPRPLGLATGVPHSLLMQEDGGNVNGFPLRAVPGYQPFGRALLAPRALGEPLLEPIDGYR
ncbi:MAG TPA: hypothetical protein VGG33_13600 [Polyangia bacterium]